MLSTPAFSTHVIWCHVFPSRIFQVCIFDGAMFSTPAFSVAPTDDCWFQLCVLMCFSYPRPVLLRLYMIHFCVLLYIFWRYGHQYQWSNLLCDESDVTYPQSHKVTSQKYYNITNKTAQNCQQLENYSHHLDTHVHTRTSFKSRHTAACRTSLDVWENLSAKWCSLIFV